jgi:hypothetical protein
MPMPAPPLRVQPAVFMFSPARAKKVQQAVPAWAGRKIYFLTVKFSGDIPLHKHSDRFSPSCFP